MLPPVTLPVTVICPADTKLPPVTFPATLSAVLLVLAMATVVIALNPTEPNPPATEDPILIKVFEREVPAVPMLMVFVLPATVGPVPML